MRDAVVIGAGANGLTAAAALARAGMDVVVLERADTLAGQARTLELGPGFLAAPLALDGGWAPPAVMRGLGLSLPSGPATATPLTVATGDGEFLPLAADAARAGDAIRRHSHADATTWPAFVARTRRLAGFLEELYQRPAPAIEAASLREAWPLLGLARKLRGLGRGDMTELLRVVPASVHQLAEDTFESAVVRAVVAACGVRDVRQGPRSGGTGFVLLHHLTGAPAGALRRSGAAGERPDAFARAVEGACAASGVTLRTGAEVARILVEDEAAAGVVLASGEEIRAARVLSAADPVRTLLGMVDPVWLEPELLLALGNIRFRGCTAFVLYAMDELPPLPGAGDATAAWSGAVSLTPHLDVLERAADAAKYGMLPERPHVELSAPSLHWRDHAPAGKHVVVARAQYAPYRLRAGTAWDGARADALADAVGRVIEEAVPCFSSRVLHRLTLTPRDLEERYGLTEGAPTQGELGLDQILFMRPIPSLAHHATPIDGLYLCGAGTHPGPGVPGGPGWLAARRVIADARRPAPSR